MLTTISRAIAYTLALVIALALIPMITPASPAKATGSSGRTDFNNHQYQLFDISMTWTEAKAYCENLGGHLVTITDEAEQEFLNGLVVQGTKNRYFIGAYRNDRNSNWLWVTGEEFSYTNWKSGEPNSPYEHVIEIFAKPYPTASAGEWNNIMDNGDYGQDVNVRVSEYFGLENVGFICEWEAAVATPTPTPTPTPSGDNAIVGRYTSNRGTWFDPVTGEQISRGSASSIALWVCIEFRADGTYAEYATMERSHTWADTDVSTSWEHGNYSVVDGTVVLVNIIQTRHFLVETDRNYDNRPMDDVTKTLEIDEFGLRLNGLRYFRFED